MGCALIKSAKTIRAQGLHDAHVNISIVVAHEGGAVKLDVVGQTVKIMIEQLLAQLRRQVGLGVIQNGSNVVLQRSLASALIVQKEWPVIAQHDVARLEITVKKIFAVGGQQKAGQAPKIIFQRLLIERNACETKKIIFEIVQVPGNRLAVKAAPRITHFVIQIATSLDLEARQHGNRLAVCLNY